MDDSTFDKTRYTLNIFQKYFVPDANMGMIILTILFTIIVKI